MSFIDLEVMDIYRSRMSSLFESRNSRGGQGCQMWDKTETDWHQMGQIWDFLRSVSVQFGSLFS